MKIKEVERQTGITSANIRFYEKEGLLEPHRNPENNYREYSEEDVWRIQRIKTLRMLGVPVADIKLLFDGKKELEEIMEQRVLSISEEEKYLAETKKLCEEIIVRKLDVDTLNETVFAENKEVWNSKLEELLNKDIVKEVITRKELNRNLAFLLGIGSLINAIVSFVAANVFLKYSSNDLIPWEDRYPSTLWARYDIDIAATFIIFIIIAVICAITVHFTAKVGVLFVNYIITSVILTPIIMTLFRFGKMEFDWGLWLTNKHIMGFWIIITVYIFLLWSISEVWKPLFTKIRYTLVIDVVLWGAFTGLVYVLVGKILLPGIALGIAFLYISINWTTANMDKKEYNRYYAVITAIRIMNIVAMAVHMKGRSQQWLGR